MVRLNRKTRSELEGWLRASTTEQRMVRRARIVLLAAEGWASRAIARKVGVMTGVVSAWRTRFAASGIVVALVGELQYAGLKQQNVIAA